jgi:hypothetical protein
MYHRGSHWKNFREIRNRGLYEHLSRKYKFGYSQTTISSNLIEDPMTLRYFRKHGFAIKARLAVTSSSTVHREGIVAFPLKEWLRERTTVLCYTYIADLFQGERGYVRPVVIFYSLLLYTSGNAEVVLLPNCEGC